MNWWCIGCFNKTEDYQLADGCYENKSLKKIIDGGFEQNGIFKLDIMVIRMYERKYRCMYTYRYLNSVMSIGVDK